MKKLVIIRHGKSSWDSPLLADHERPLAPRGLRDCPKMAQRIKKRAVHPDAIISSDASRARNTALIFAEQLHFDKNNIHFTEKLYHASAETILSLIGKTTQDVKTLFIVGHNPGLNDLIWKLGGEIDNLPTAGQFAFELTTDNWSEINQKTTKPLFFDYPKK